MSKGALRQLFILKLDSKIEVLLDNFIKNNTESFCNPRCIVIKLKTITKFLLRWLHLLILNPERILVLPNVPNFNLIMSTKSTYLQKHSILISILIKMSMLLKVSTHFSNFIHKPTLGMMEDPIIDSYRAYNQNLERLKMK